MTSVAGPYSADLVGLLENHDPETARHTIRVVKLAEQLGIVAALMPAQLRALQLGAYFHDIGKLAIPDRVLLKPSPLNAQEWAFMQTHSELGARMAAQLLRLPTMAIEVIRSHHERWDGTGYPQGLAGEQIPLLARIFSICDVYDALISTRPYKQAWTSIAARVELVNQAGKQFDPFLIDLFVNKICPGALQA